MLSGGLLLVDDTPDSLRVLVHMLSQRGYRIRSANNGGRALASAIKSPPDLILLDICMPDMSGFEVCRELKRNQATRDIPVLFISALDETSDKLRAFQEGGVDYITKPFQEAEVVARIETQLTILRQRRQLQEDYLRLRRLEELRDGLTHMMVHDLRSPLTGIIGYVHLLRRLAGSRLGPEELSCLTQVKDLSGTLVDMVGSILDVSRLEADELPLSLKSVRLDSITREALDSLGALRERCVQINRCHDLEFHCDSELIRRVLANLASNAIRYSPPGEVVEVQLSRSGNAVEARVCDRGPGIPPEHQQRIFEKFAQVERRGHHSGLGLTFCKLVVEKHAGQIGVDSIAGEGCQFWIRLPVEPATCA